MSLSIFLNEINKDDNNAILESYTYFGIDHDVALESAMETIKEKFGKAIEKIKEWVTKFINWIRVIFKKKIKEVKEKETKSENSHSDNTEKVSGNTDTKKLVSAEIKKTAMIDRNVFDAWVRLIKEIEDYAFTIEEKVGKILSEKGNSDELHMGLGQLGGVNNYLVTRLDDMRINNKILKELDGSFDNAVNRIEQGLLKFQNDIRTLEKIKKVLDNDTQTDWGRMLMSRSLSAYQSIISAYSALQRVGMLLLNNVTYK